MAHVKQARLCLWEVRHFWGSSIFSSQHELIVYPLSWCQSGSQSVFLSHFLVTTVALSFLIRSSSFLQVRRTTIKAWMSLNFNQIRPLTLELPALEVLKNQSIIWYNVVNTLAHSFVIGSSSFLQVTKTTIKSLMSLKFGQIQPWTAELAALDRLKKYFTYLRTIQTILMTS